MKRVLRTNPGEPQFPGRPQRIIKKKSGHIIITRVLFLTVLQLDVRHQSPTAAARRADPNAGRKRGTTLLPPCPRRARLAPHWTGNTLSLESKRVAGSIPTWGHPVKILHAAFLSEKLSSCFLFTQ